MAGRTPYRLALGMVLTGFLAGCENPSFVSGPHAPVPPVLGQLPTELSRETAAYYARVEANLVSKGLLRTDRGGPDTPYGRDDLVRNFLQIALYSEYTDDGTELKPQPKAQKLQRWAVPVRMKVVTGASVTAAEASRDRAEVADYAARLARATGHSISMTDSTDANFTVLFLDEEERRAWGEALPQTVPGLSRATMREVTNLPLSTYCLVFAIDAADNGTFTRAFAIVRAEHPPLLRQSCINEELAQGLGLSNDSPRARPSIFNDDNEFALLTSQDELLLKILYDPRLKPGMTEEEARPVVEAITLGMTGGES